MLGGTERLLWLLLRAAAARPECVGTRRPGKAEEGTEEAGSAGLGAGLQGPAGTTGGGRRALQTLLKLSSAAACGLRAVGRMRRRRRGPR